MLVTILLPFQSIIVPHPPQLKLSNERRGDYDTYGGCSQGGGVHMSGSSIQNSIVVKSMEVKMQSDIELHFILKQTIENKKM